MTLHNFLVERAKSLAARTLRQLEFPACFSAKTEEAIFGRFQKIQAGSFCATRGAAKIITTTPLVD
jgi:hypothetical protein